MRMHTTAALASILIIPLAVMAQDSKPLAPFERLAASETERLEKDIQGTWLLMELTSPEILIDPADVAGYALFREGFVSLVIHARSIQPGFLGVRQNLFYQGGVRRYRISRGQSLQMVSMIEHHNFTSGAELAFERPGTASQFSVNLADNALTLRTEKGDAFIFRRVTSRGFPKQAEERFLDGAGVRK